jgi:hypothetical protein
MMVALKSPPFPIPAPRKRRHADRPSPGSQILHSAVHKRRRPCQKRQISTSLSGGTIHFLSRCSGTNCNDIIFIHQGVSLKDKRAFLVEKYEFSCRRHFHRVDFREIASLSTLQLLHGVMFLLSFNIYFKYNASLQADSRSRLSRDAS